ncbi:hypothetical protein LJR220_001431 [Bradyrhizobium sp. LjRoot220]|uniref:hypothetical protein n=1 Tax=Bradyrhizobium sp. LjRoot220 TaxID=3342284 RepID=UPI003ED0AAB0
MPSEIARPHDVGRLCKQLARRNFANAGQAELFSEAFRHALPADKRAVTAFGGAIITFRASALETLTSPSLISVSVNVSLRLFSTGDCQQMSLAAGLGDFNGQFNVRRLEFSQNGRGYQRVIVKRELTDRLAWREIWHRGQGLN